MGRAGPELGPVSLCTGSRLGASAGEGDARDDVRWSCTGRQVPPDLQEVIEAWPTLAPSIRGLILAAVRDQMK
jgi:hypothetical protein